MVALRVGAFQGSVPRTSPENLSGSQAQVATNCRLWNGKLKPWNGRLNVKAVSAGVKSALNLQGNWLTFQEDVDIAQSQLAGDQTGRIFFTGDGAPQMTDLSMAVIGNTSVITPTASGHVIPNSFVNAATIASLGIAVGNYINASVQIADPKAEVVNGRVQITFFNSTPAVISTTDGAMVQGCGEYDVSLLTHLLVPAGTVSITVKALADAFSTGATARFCYLTIGDFSAATLPVASVPLGLSQPSVPTAALVVPKVSITGATSNAAAIASGANTVLACDGTEVVCTGRLRFSAQVTSVVNGDVTVTLTRGGVAVASKAFAFDVHGSTTEPANGSVTGNFTLTDQPPSGNETYTLVVTKSFSGSVGLNSASGTISFDDAIDITCTGRTANHAYSVGDTILDGNGNLDMAIAVTGNSATGGGPTFAKARGDLTTDGGVTWCLINTMDVGTPLSIAGVHGMTDLDGAARIVSVTANVIRVAVNSQQTYTSGGTITLPLTTTAEVNSIEDRVYAYTYVSNLDGETMESEPSAASKLMAVASDRIVSVTLPATPSGFGITTANIYRTIADGNGAAVLVFVTAVAVTDGVTPTPYYDALADTQLDGTLLTSTWNPPPADMLGIVALPNGVYVGFNSNQIIPSVPFQPHAYPDDYQLGTEFEIVSVKPFGQSLAVLTKGKPYVVNGLDPSTWDLQLIDMKQPCMSKRSVVDMGVGVVYSCPDGLAMISNGGVQIISQALFTQDVWDALDPTSMLAANYGGLYVCFYTGGNGGGFIVDPSDPTSFTSLDFQATAMWTDPSTNNLYMVVANEIVQWDADAANPLTYTWQSKDFVTPHPLNLCRGKIRAKGYPVTFELYGDGTLMATKTVTNASVFTLPAGKAQVYSMVVTGTKEILEVVASESVEEIAAGLSQMTSMQAPVG